MAWTVPVTTEDGVTYPVHFDGDEQPSPEDIDYAANQLVASHEGQPSVLGSFGRSVARNIIPATIGGRFGAMAGAAAGGALEGAVAGSEFPVVGNIVGGLIGAGLGMYGTSKIQEAGANAVNPTASNPFSTASEQQDVETNPNASLLGGLAAAGRPSVKTLANVVESTATGEGRNLIKSGFELAKRAAGAATPEEAAQIVAENPAAYDAFTNAANVGGNVGIGTVQGALQGQSPADILKGAAGGALFNQGWFHGAPNAKEGASEPVPAEPQPVLSDPVLAQKAATIHVAKSDPDTALAAQAAEQKLTDNIQKKGAENQIQYEDKKTTALDELDTIHDSITDENRKETESKWYLSLAKHLREGTAESSWLPKENLEALRENGIDISDKNAVANAIENAVKLKTNETEPPVQQQEVPTVQPSPEGEAGPERPSNAVPAEQSPATPESGAEPAAGENIEPPTLQENVLPPVENPTPNVEGAENTLADTQTTNGENAEATLESVDEGFAAKNEHVNALLKEHNLPEPTKTVQKDMATELEKHQALYSANPDRIEKLVKRQNDDPQHAVTPEEQGLFRVHGEFLSRSLDALLERSKDSKLSADERALASEQYNDVRKKLHDFGNANTFAGSTTGLALRMRQVEKASDLSLSQLILNAEQANGGKMLTEAQEKPLREIAAKAKEAAEGKQKETEAKEQKNTQKEKKAQDDELEATRKAVEKTVKKSGGKKRISTAEKKDLLDTIFGKKAPADSNKIMSSTPIEEGGSPVVTEAHQNEAVSNLKKTVVGRKILENSIVVPDWERAISNDAFEGRDFSPDEYNTIKKSEGFFDPVTGKSVVIRDNVRPKNGETPEEAVRRVLLHERVGHDGIEALRELDPEFDKKYRQAVANIPKAELDSVKELYGKNPDLAIKELIARKFEAQDPNQPPNPNTWWGKLWQAVRDLYARYIGRSDSKFDQQIRDLFRDVIHSPEALESRRGFGDVMASLPEGEEEPAAKVPASIREVPKSVLDRLMYEHIAEGGLEPGEKGIQEITKRMKADFEPYLGEISDDEMQKAIVDYGKEVHPTTDEVQKEKSLRKQEILKLQQLKEAKATPEGGEPPALRQIREKPSQYSRELEKELKDTIEERRLSRQNEEQQRATKLDAKKSRLNNSIEDVEKQIADLKEGKTLSERPKSKVQNDTEAADLEKKLKGLRSDRDKILEEQNKDAAEKEKRAKEAQKAQNDLDDAQAKIIQLEEKLNSGDLSKNPAKHKEVSAELQAARDQIKGLNKEVVKARSEAGRPAREAEAEAKELQDAKDKVAEKEAKLKSGDVFNDPAKKRQVSAELEAERANLADVNKRIAERRKELESHTPPTAEEEQQALDTIIKRKKAVLDKLEKTNQRIRSGEQVERSVRPKPVERPEISPYDAQIKQARNEAESHYRKIEQANRTPSQKVLDNVVKFKKGAVLSSIPVYAKLASAVASRAVTHGVEEGVGGVLSHIPGVREVAAKAPLEGRFSSTALSKGVAKALTHLVSDAKSIWKTGRTELDQYSGRPDLHDGGLVDMIGRLHAIVKSPIKRFAFEHAAQKLTEFELRQNPSVDLESEPVKLKIMTGAYKAAERAVFQQDNAVAAAFEAAMAVMEKQGLPNVARFGRLLLPIVKVPTNMVGEAIQYAGGVPVGLVKLGKVWHQGINSLQPNEADLIMRQLKKGSVGSALLALGYFAADSIGGFYQSDQKQKVGDVKPGTIRLGDVDIPAWLMHSPAFQVLQMGATMRRVADHSGVPAGVWASATGLISETPFINEMNSLKDWGTAKGGEKFLGNLARAQIPQVLQNVAAWTDQGPARKPETILQNIEMGLPGARENVPIKVSDALPPSDKGVVPKAIQEYSIKGGVMPAAPSKNEMLKKYPTLTDDQFARYAETRGQIVKRSLLAQISSLSKLPPDEQKKNVEAISKRASDAAKMTLHLKAKT